MGKVKDIFNKCRLCGKIGSNKVMKDHIRKNHRNVVHTDWHDLAVKMQ